MSKHLTPLSFAALFALSTGCIIVGSGTDGDTEATASTSTTNSTSTTGSTGTDSEGTDSEGTDSEGTDSEGTGSATDSDSDSTSATDSDSTSTTSSETDPTATDTDGTGTATDTDGTGTDTDGALPCGWNSRENYYDCEGNGGVPGAEDPMMLVPYFCPDQPLEVDGKCGDVDNLGCCDAEGNLWFCNNTLATEMCGG